jgi:hypothetical protein
MNEKPEHGRYTLLRNAGICLQVHTALQPQGPTWTSSKPWEPCISYFINLWLLLTNTISAVNKINI